MKKILLICAILSVLMASTGCGVLSLLQKEEPIPLNQKITINDYAEYEIKGVMILDSIIDGDANFSKNDGMKYLCALTNIKNLYTEDIDLKKCISFEATFNDKQKYDSVEYDIADEPTKKSDGFTINLGGKTLPPLKDNRVWIALKIPDEVVSQPEKINIKFKLKDKKYSYDKEVDVANDFIGKIRDLAKRYYDVHQSYYESITRLNSASFSSSKYAVEEVSSKAKTNKFKTDKILEDLSEITPPSCYKEGYEAMKKYISLMNSSFDRLSAQHSLNGISDALSASVEEAKSANSADAAKTMMNNMSFLKSTDLGDVISSE